MISSQDSLTDQRQRLPGLILAGLTLGALALRLTRLDAESLWMDEIVTVETYHLDPWGVVRAAAVVGQPPLDNIIGAALARLGLAESDWWVRFPSALLGAGGVGLLGLLIWRVAGPFAGLIAALFLAVCPIHLAMSQEVRPYALNFFLSLACVLAFQIARNRNMVSSWMLFALSAFLLLMTRWTDPQFILLGIGFYALTVRLRAWNDESHVMRWQEQRRFRWTLLSLIVAYGLYAPFFAIVLGASRQAVQSQSTNWAIRAGWFLISGFRGLFSGYSTSVVFNSINTNTWLIVLGCVAALVGLGVLISRAKRGQTGIGLFLAVFLSFPFTYAAVYALLANAVPKPQYLLVGAVLLFGCVAVAIDAIREELQRSKRSIGILVCFAAIALFAVPMTRESLASLARVDKRDWRGVMGHLRANAQAGDVAAVVASDSVPPVFSPLAFGKARYGPDQLQLVPIRLDTMPSILDAAGWNEKCGTTWMLVYTDRMYLGFDQVTPPVQLPSTMRLHRFNGLFLLEVTGKGIAKEKLMAGIETLYRELPNGRSLIAPALLRSRWLSAKGDLPAAAAAFDQAIHQCRSPQEIDTLRQLFESDSKNTSVAVRP